MYKHGAWMLCGLLAGAAAAANPQDSTEPQPVVVAQAKAARSLDEPGTSARDVADLQNCVLKLKAECDALATEQEIAKKLLPADPALEGAESAKMRLRLGELMSKLTTQGGSKKGDEHGSAPPLWPAGIDAGAKNDLNKQTQGVDKGLSKNNGPQAADAADPRALANVLFKAGNFDLALKAYRLVSLNGMRPDERAPLQYLMATCLRKTGKMEEAAALYREVANIRGDEQVASCAQWQLVQLRWQIDFEAQLKDLQERRKALEAPP